MQCMLKYEIQATLEQRKRFYAMKSKNNATKLCYDSLYEICKWEERALLLKKNER